MRLYFQLGGWYITFGVQHGWRNLVDAGVSDYRQLALGIYSS